MVYERGVTLLDTLVGIGLMMIVFTSITAAFQLSTSVVTNSKARAGAIALAGEQMEYLRSLDYNSLGTVGGIPSGPAEQEEAIALNGVDYTRRTFVAFGDDPYDGVGGADATGNTDYKWGRVDVYWRGRDSSTHHITLLGRFESPNGTDVACTGSCGTLTINAVNALSQPVLNAEVTIVNTSANPQINLTTYTNSSGVSTFPGATTTGSYEITVTKDGYSSAQTYDADAQNTSPNPGHLTVSNGNTTSYTFGIDLLATKIVKTYSPISSTSWTDTFTDSGNLSQSSNVTVSGGAAQLTADLEGHYSYTGTMTSTPLAPSYLADWENISWSDATPSGSSVVYQVYDGTTGTPLPDGALAGNSTGFASSPVDISGVSTSTYPSLQLHATLSTPDQNVTPTVDSWDIGYAYGPVPLPNISFQLTSLDKTIGSGPSGTIYKYDQTQSSGAGGSVTLSNMEWADQYQVSILSSAYEPAAWCEPQPEALSPGSTQTTSVMLAASTTNSLLVSVADASSNAHIYQASVRVYKTGYDQTKKTETCGQLLFGGLSSGTYNVIVTKGGYQTYGPATITVSGHTSTTTQLHL